jgi:selenocysteine lyase/cysteine desulfurase
MGGYEAAALADNKIAGFYPTVAKLINAKATEIAYTENATRAWDMVFYSLRFQPGDKIITAEAEYASNYIAFLQVAKRTGAVIEVIPNDASGQLSISELENRIDAKTKLIAVTHVPTQGGLINPAEEVGRVARKHGIFYLLDATQSVGQMPIDVQKIGCDALCATGRKFLRGPRGTGFLYVSERALSDLEPPFLDLHAATWTEKNAYTMMPDARRFETWETNYSSKIGLAAAVEYAMEWGLDSIWHRILELSSNLRKQLSAIPGITLEDLGAHQCGIVTFISSKTDPQTLCAKLKERKINVSVSLQEYARLDLEARGLPSLVRASVHYYNTQEEIDRFCNELNKFQY